MTAPIWLAAFSIGIFLLTVSLLRIVTIWLRRRAILDHPNRRSSHARPVPRGGGIALLAALLVMIPVAARAGLPVPPLPIMAGFLILSAVSWRDDLRSLPASLRLAVQAVIVAAMLWAAPELNILPGVGWVGWAGYPLTALLWLWFINLFNFMDGIDGIAGVEITAIGLGVVALAGFAEAGGAPSAAVSLAALLTGAALGFLVWNWHPARIFLGDVGSIPIGFALGWLLLALAQQGYWSAALILPAYYLADATVTLLRRAVRGARVWRAHREHFYQQAVQAGRSHGWVAGRIAGLNAALVVCALVAETVPGGRWPALFVAGLLTAATLWAFSGPRDIRDDR